MFDVVLLGCALITDVYPVFELLHHFDMGNDTDVSTHVLPPSSVSKGLVSFMYI